MSIAVWTSFEQITNAAGTPQSGAKIYVYAAGTTTPLTLYSDPGLGGGDTTANPIICDAGGQHGMTYIAAGTAYKTTVTTSADVSLASWSKDNIDAGVPSGSGALPIAAGGTGGTTAGQARTNLDVPSNSELADLAADILDISSQISSIVSVPQGYLTLTSGTPVIAGDVAAATAVYYTPFTGAQIPIYNGSLFVIETFAELTLTLNGNHIASSIYDCFVIDDGGTLRLVTGPAWNNATAGACSRGSGAGTTELERVSGLWVNKNAATMRYGATTVSVDAREGTYVGSIYMDGTNGQITCHRTWGSSRKWGVWNAYNRQRTYLKAGEASASWTYASGTVRASNDDATNVCTIFSGLAEDVVACEHRIYVNPASSTLCTVGIGYNSTTAASGHSGQVGTYGNSGTIVVMAKYLAPPAIGINNIQALEASSGNTSTFNGSSETNHCLSTEWMA